MAGVPTGEETQADNEKRLGSSYFCTTKTKYLHLLQEMRLSDPESHFRYIRMSKGFDTLLAKVTITSTCLNYVFSINDSSFPIQEFLASTLCFLLVSFSTSKTFQ